MAAMNPELMKLVGGGPKPPAPIPGGPQGAGGQPPGVPGSAPVASPMSTPEPKEGDKMGAYVQIQMAMDLLEKTLPALGSESEEGSSILDALKGLGKQFGDKRDKSKELVPAELMSLMGQMPKGPAAGGGAPPPAVPGAGGPGAMPPPQMTQ